MSLPSHELRFGLAQKRSGWSEAFRLGCDPTQVDAVFTGTEVTRLSAEDMDAPGSPNSHIVYQLLSPEPEEGADGRAFELDFTSGSVTLGDAPLRAAQNILLRVMAADRGGAEGSRCPDGDPGSLPPCSFPGLSNMPSPASGLSSTCEVAVTITDINDHAPEFTVSQVSRNRGGDLGKALMRGSWPLRISPRLSL